MRVKICFCKNIFNCVNLNNNLDKYINFYLHDLLLNNNNMVPIYRNTLDPFLNFTKHVNFSNFMLV